MIYRNTVEIDKHHYSWYEKSYLLCNETHINNTWRTL